MPIQEVQPKHKNIKNIIIYINIQYIYNNNVKKNIIIYKFISSMIGVPLPLLRSYLMDNLLYVLYSIVADASQTFVILTTMIFRFLRRSRRDI